MHSTQLLNSLLTLHAKSRSQGSASSGKVSGGVMASWAPAILCEIKYEDASTETKPSH